MDDEDEKDNAVKIEAANDLLEISELPLFYINKAKNLLCHLLTKTKEYEQARPMCQYIINNRSSLDESIDVVDAYCDIATGYLADEKYEEAKRVVQDGLKDNQQNKKVIIHSFTL